jgi:hypothetical protein
MNSFTFFIFTLLSFYMQVWLVFPPLLITSIEMHYMFWPNWPSSSVQFGFITATAVVSLMS